MGLLRLDGEIHNNISELAIHNGALLYKRGSRVNVIDLHLEEGKPVVVNISDFLGKDISIKEVTVLSDGSLPDLKHCGYTEYVGIGLAGDFERFIVDRDTRCYLSIPVKGKCSFINVDGSSVGINNYRSV